MDLFLISLMLVVVAAFAALATTLGVDSRDGWDDGWSPAEHAGLA